MKAILEKITAQDIFLLVGTAFILYCCAHSIINL